MANITTCTTCGKCYEESSEEAANAPNRECAECWHKHDDREQEYLEIPKFLRRYDD